MTITLNEMLDNLDNGKMYYRRLKYNDKPLPHKHRLKTEGDSGFYINGFEFFEHKGGYWMKVYTVWEGTVYLDTVVKFKRKNNGIRITIFRINTFSLSGGECVPWRNLKDGEETVKEWVDVINDNMEDVDKDSLIHLKEKSNVTYIVKIPIVN